MSAQTWAWGWFPAGENSPTWSSVSRCTLSHTHLACAVTPVASQSCLLGPETPAWSRGGVGMEQEDLLGSVVSGLELEAEQRDSTPCGGQAPSSRTAKS